ncbi:ABC-type nitrate/sulfonate/taurine/bicarbonate transport systems, periplasmic component [Desulforamulus reducens MI-1]|uniref:Thiamine pyrimidine synthase n=1 Tax=Desulforamulus reducens (strain ATCC BAA-1160 / DSM 100696 / MI-1) TaxID=349161 RepID=A4J7L3_DESRM|nr:ABC-type nitrate/sulfonate/taurine/bicarbonate transport systems, periplasmic component [Desulforamulus reducens MI-1]
MRIRWRLWLFILLLLFAIVGLGTFGVKNFLFYSQETEKPDRIKVVEGQLTFLALPHYIALTQGFYREQNLEVETAVTNTPPEEQLNLKGQGDVFLGNLCQTVFTRPLGTGADLVAFGALAQKEGAFLLSRKDDQKFSWENVKKKIILGDAPDTQSNIILEEALRQNNLALQHHVIIVQNLPSNLKEGAFQAGVAHYLQMPQPFAYQIQENQLGKIAIFLGDAVAPIPSLVILAPESYLKQHSKECQKLVNGLCKGLLWLDYHKPEEATRVVASYFPELDKKTLTAIIKQYKELGMWGKNPLIAEEHYEHLKAYVSRAGELTNPVKFSDGVNNKLAKKAAKTVKYIPPEQQKEKTWWEKVKSLDFK